MDATARYLATHQSHDSLALIRRWKAVARLARLRLSVICRAGGFPVLFLHSRKLTPKALYVSAGVHGDEPAAVSGLLEWAEVNISRLAAAEVAIFPLFNPAGLRANTRLNEEGIDLNRRFHDAGHPHIAAWQTAVSGLRFQLAAMLHEDYDAQGIYCYELNDGPPIAGDLLSKVEHSLPRDQRIRIDGRKAKNGVIRRSKAPTDLPGTPEAIQLYHNGAALTLTFESPSEHSLFDRVQAHRAFADALFERCGW